MTATADAGRLETEAEALASRNATVEANLKLVHHVLKTRFSVQPGGNKYGVEYEDLVQFGAFGLLRAAEKFTEEREGTFSTYAVVWITSAVRAELRRDHYGVRLPAHARTEYGRYRRVAATLGPEAEPEAVVRKMGLTGPPARRVAGLAALMGKVRVPLEFPVEGRERPPGEALASADEADEVKRLMARLVKAADLIPARQREAFLLRSVGGLPTGEVAKRMGLTESSIRDLCMRATTGLRAILSPPGRRPAPIRLSPKQRLALELRDKGGASFEEIAERLVVSVTSAKTLVRKARQRSVA